MENLLITIIAIAVFMSAVYWIRKYVGSKKGNYKGSGSRKRPDLGSEPKDKPRR
jgi:hypothetical protein